MLPKRFFNIIQVVLVLTILVSTLSLVSVGMAKGKLPPGTALPTCGGYISVGKCSKMATVRYPNPNCPNGYDYEYDEYQYLRFQNGRKTGSFVGHKIVCMEQIPEYCWDTCK